MTVKALRVVLGTIWRFNLCVPSAGKKK